MESMLFNYETIYKTSYKSHEIRAPIFTLYNKKSEPKIRERKPLKDVHTLSDWKTEAIPFNLLHRPKSITRTNPTKIQEKCVSIMIHSHKLASEHESTYYTSIQVLYILNDFTSISF